MIVRNQVTLQSLCVYLITERTVVPVKLRFERLKGPHCLTVHVFSDVGRTRGSTYSPHPKITPNRWRQNGFFFLLEVETLITLFYSKIQAENTDLFSLGVQGPVNPELPGFALPKVTTNAILRTLYEDHRILNFVSITFKNLNNKVQNLKNERQEELLIPSGTGRIGFRRSSLYLQSLRVHSETQNH